MKNLNESIAILPGKSSNLQFVEQRTCIAVGITAHRLRSRVSILLNELLEYYVKYISSGDGDM